MQRCRAVMIYSSACMLVLSGLAIASPLGGEPVNVISNNQQAPDLERRSISTSSGLQQLRLQPTVAPRLDLKSAGRNAPLITLRGFLRSYDFNRVPELTPAQLRLRLLQNPQTPVLDFAKADDFSAMHIPGSRHVPLAKLLIGNRSFLPADANKGEPLVLM